MDDDSAGIAAKGIIMLRTAPDGINALQVQGARSAFEGYTGKHGMIIDEYSQINRNQLTTDNPLNFALSLLSVLHFVSNLGPRMIYQPSDSRSSRFRMRCLSPFASLP